MENENNETVEFDYVEPTMVETVTPLYTLDWYIKWVATVFIMIAIICVLLVLSMLCMTSSSD